MERKIEIKKVLIIIGIIASFPIFNVNAMKKKTIVNVDNTNLKSDIKIKNSQREIVTIKKFVEKELKNYRKKMK